jgi:Flp pilus assembly protein TadD
MKKLFELQPNNAKAHKDLGTALLECEQGG